MNKHRTSLIAVLLMSLSTALSAPIEKKSTSQKTGIKDAQEVTSLKEFSAILAQKQPLIIMFYAPWCGACKSMKEPFNELAQQFKTSVQMVKINAENESLKDIVDFFEIEAIPTIVVKHVGVLQKEQLKALASSVIKKPSVTQKKPTAAKKTSQKTPQKAPKKAPQKKQQIPVQKKRK